MSWRTGRKAGRTIYNDVDEMIGVMDTPELATVVVDAVNEAFIYERRVSEFEEKLAQLRAELTSLMQATEAPP